MASSLRVLLALGVLAFAAPSLADPTAAEKETARNLMDEGHTLRDDKNDPKDALERFKAADQIMHVPVTAYEVAVTQVQLGLLVEARETIAHILSQPAKRGEPAPFREARAKSQALDDQIASRIATLVVTIHGPSEGAKVTIDGTELPASLIGLESRANPGHHVVAVMTAKMQGRSEVDLADGEKKEVTVELAPIAVEHEEPAPVAKEAPPPAEHHGARTAGLVMIGLGAAGLVAGGVTGGLTFAKQSDLSAACPNHVCGPESHDLLAQANMFATISTVAFIAGGVLGVAGIVTFIVGKPSAQPAPASAHVEPWLGLGAAGLRGTF